MFLVYQSRASGSRLIKVNVCGIDIQSLVLFILLTHCRDPPWVYYSHRPSVYIFLMIYIYGYTVLYNCQDSNVLYIRCNVSLLIAYSSWLLHT